VPDDWESHTIYEVVQDVVPDSDAIVTNISYDVNICDENLQYSGNTSRRLKRSTPSPFSRLIVKPGQPDLGDRDAYIAEMARRCTVVPQSIAE
jgi:hypothetical protein